MKKLLLSALTIGVMFVSCGKKDDNPTKPTMADKVPAKGVFVDIYSIQENMYKESSDKLIGTFDKFKSKIAVGPNQATTQEQFADWIKNVKPEGDAAKGKAGKLGKRYLTEKGIENGQLIKKGLIGAYQLSSAFAEYNKMFPPNKLDKNEQQELLKNFSTAIIGSYDMIDNEKVEMESHGKKFMGYPVMNGNEFAKYLNVVNNYDQYKGISDKLYNNLKEAKKNVGNYEKFKENIREALMATQQVVAIRGVQYLKKASELSGDQLNDGVAHSISEGLGFIYSLQFANYYPKTHGVSTQIKGFNETLMSLDLWKGTEASVKLKEVGQDVAKAFDFKYEDANL